MVLNINPYPSDEQANQSNPANTTTTPTKEDESPANLNDIVPTTSELADKVADQHLLGSILYHTEMANALRERLENKILREIQEL